MNINEVQTAAHSYVVGAANNVTTGARCRVMSITVAAGVANGQILVYDALTVTGTAFIQLNAVLETTATISFAPQGVRFETGLTTTTNGTPDKTVVTYLID